MAQISLVNTALSILYTDTAKVIGKTQTLSLDGSMSFADSVLYQSIPCRLSYRSTPKATHDGVVSYVEDEIKLFCSNTYTIPSGSVIEVSRGSQTLRYKHSGIAKLYTNHQEIELDAIKEYA